MRRGTHDVNWLIEEGDTPTFMGCNLGWDFTAEHEWGTKDLYANLGVKNDPTIMGIERRVVGDIKENCLRLIHEKDSSALILLPPWYEERKIKDFGELSLFSGQELVTAWSGDDFGIHTRLKKNIKKLETLHNAFLNKDVAVWTGGGAVFGNAGLIFGIISRIPKHLKDQMRDCDIDDKNLHDASDATGIFQKIDAVNKAHIEKTGNCFSTPCGHYALCPSWVRSEYKDKTKYKVIYWLNPDQQEKNQSGWYTVEDLELWVEGKGPVKQMKRRA